jgi:hypothetical protein
MGSSLSATLEIEDAGESCPAKQQAASLRVGQAGWEPVYPQKCMLKPHA